MTPLNYLRVWLKYSIPKTKVTKISMSCIRTPTMEILACLFATYSYSYSECKHVQTHFHLILIILYAVKVCHVLGPWVDYLVQYIYNVFKATTPCPLHNLPLSLIPIARPIDRLHYRTIPHLHTLLRRFWSWVTSWDIMTWTGGLKVWIRLDWNGNMYAKIHMVPSFPLLVFGIVQTVQV